MKYIDTHTHTNCLELVEKFDEIIKDIENLDMYINIVGNNIDDSILAIKQSQNSDNSFCTIGIHPNEFKDDQSIDESITILEQLYLNNKEKVRAIGEIGLDYHFNPSQERILLQKLWFEKQINLATKYNLPVVMHIRDAHNDAYEIIKQYYDKTTFIVHCFCGTIDDVFRYNELNCYISISGIITFKNNDSLRNALMYIPLNKLLTETDAPWLAPVPFRGKTNFPQYVIKTNEYIATLLNIDLNELLTILVNNAINCFKL